MLAGPLRRKTARAGHRAVTRGTGTGPADRELRAGGERGRAWKDDSKEGDPRPRSTARCAAPAGTPATSSPTCRGPEGSCDAPRPTAPLRQADPGARSAKSHVPNMP